MTVATLSGIASHIQRSSTIHGNTRAIGQSSSTHFRIGNRQVVMKGSIQLAEGDQVTAAGDDKPEFRVLALRNDTTRLTYRVNSNVGMVGSWLIVLVSVPMIPILVGLFTMAVGIYYVRENMRIAKAVRGLEGRD